MSTGYETERQYIESRFNTNWTSATTPIKFDNVNGLLKGTASLADARGHTEWVRLSIASGESLTATVGGTTTRHPGVIVVNVFTQSGAGTDRARELCDDVFDIFNNETFNGINCQASYATTEGDVDGFYQMTVSTPFYRDQS